VNLSYSTRLFWAAIVPAVIEGVVDHDTTNRDIMTSIVVPEVAKDSWSNGNPIVAKYSGFTGTRTNPLE